MGEKIKAFIRGSYADAKDRQAREQLLKKQNSFYIELDSSRKPGRPKKSKNEIAKKYEIRLKKDLADILDGMGHQKLSGSKKVEELILRYSQLKEVFQFQINSIKNIIEAVRKIVDAMSMTKQEFRARTEQAVLIENQEEVDLVTRVLKKKQELITLIKVYGFEDHFIETQLSTKDFEFYRWFKNRS